MRCLDWHRTMIHEPEKGVMQGGKMQVRSFESKAFRKESKRKTREKKTSTHNEKHILEQEEYLMNNNVHYMQLK